MNKNIDVADIFANFTFSSNGEVIASFRMNPSDIRVAERAREISAYFKDNSEKYAELSGAEFLAQYDRELTEKINYLLGYDASETLFGNVSATTILPDGKMFATVIMETISKHIGEAMKSRFEKFKAVAKYTAKYE